MASLRKRKEESVTDFISTFSEIEPLLSKPKRDSEAVHKLFCYPAKFQAQVPELLIERFTKAGDIVLDPFGGGGTTIAASLLRSRCAVHYDLSPISCLVANAKITPITKDVVDDVARSLRSRIMKKPKRDILDSEEIKLFGSEVAETSAMIFAEIEHRIKSGHQCAPLLAVLLIKLLKLCGRRDADKRRSQSPSHHIDWLIHEMQTFAQYSEQELTFFENRGEIRCGSNHEMSIQDHSIDLIVTSPPYAGVDVEYSLIQIQRRDLHRCYRSDVGLRISNLFYKGDIDKKSLCAGGQNKDYFDNAYHSLKEMRRVLKIGRFAFLYTGFKCEFDRSRYEKIIDSSGFDLIKRSSVTLSDDRIASSRSTHHGKATNMMKRDYLYVLR